MSATTGTIPVYTFPEHRAGDSFGGQSFRLNRGTALLPDYIDLTGADILVEFRSSTASRPALTFTTQGLSPTISITGGGETLNLLARTGAEMDLPAGTYTADVDIKLGNGNRTRFELVLEVVADYSRRTTA
jgi:hypothetical protein